MRQWNVNPEILCRNHLLGEHHKLHYAAGYLRKKNPIIKRWADKGFIEVGTLRKRHRELVKEMKIRGYKHASPLPDFKRIKLGKVDKERNLRDLQNRCSECNLRIAKN